MELDIIPTMQLKEMATHYRLDRIVAKNTRDLSEPGHIKAHLNGDIDVLSSKILQVETELARRGAGLFPAASKAAQ